MIAALRHVTNVFLIAEYHFKNSAGPSPTSSDDFTSDEAPPIGETVFKTIIPSSISWRSSIGDTMPLVRHLREGFESDKPAGWHRNDERQARGFLPVKNLATQLEGWERELVWMEILLLTGNWETTFRHLAHGWGRDKGFHMVLAQFICRRHGNVERKKRDQSALKQAINNRSKTTLPESIQQHTISAADLNASCYRENSSSTALVANMIDFEPLSHSKSESEEEEFSFSGFDFESWDENSGINQAYCQYESESSVDSQLHQDIRTRPCPPELMVTDEVSCTSSHNLARNRSATDYRHFDNVAPTAAGILSGTYSNKQDNAGHNSVLNGYRHNHNGEVENLSSAVYYQTSDIAFVNPDN